MAVFLVRHTRVSSPKGVCYGRLNVGLSDSFLQEAENIKKQLNSLSFNNVYTSPSDRCVRLAEYCGYSNAIKSDALMELNFGDWEGKKWDDLDMSIWADDWVNNPPPNGESFTQMYERVKNFLKKLPTENSTLIFTHKGVINCARSYYSDIPLKSTFDIPLDYGEMLTF